MKMWSLWYCLLAWSSACAALSASPDGSLPPLPMSRHRLQWREHVLQGTKLIMEKATMQAPLSLALVVPRPVTLRQERHLSVNLSLLATDDKSGLLRGDAHIMSFQEALNASTSYFHWSYLDFRTEPMSVLNCWVRVHATDWEKHPCSTSHIRKNPQLYPRLYPDLYPDGPPGEEHHQLQCDQTEFSHVDPDEALNYTMYMDEAATPLCVELQVVLKPANLDDRSTWATVWLWHKGRATQVSNPVTSQINGFFKYSTVFNNQDDDKPEIHTSELFLKRLDFRMTAVGDGGVAPVLLRNATCASSLARLAKAGSLVDSPPTQNEEPKEEQVGEYVWKQETLHPPPRPCYPEVNMTMLEAHVSERLRTQLGPRIKQELSKGGQTRFSVPPPPSSFTPEAYRFRPFAHNFWNTYTPLYENNQNYTHFWTLAFQEPTTMFNEGNHTHLIGVARVERLANPPDRVYSNDLAVFEVAFEHGYQVGGHVVSFNTPTGNFSLHGFADRVGPGDLCYCRMTLNVVPLCVTGTCSRAWAHPTTIPVKKISGPMPHPDTCSTKCP